MTINSPEIVDLGDLPKRGQLIAHEGRTYVVNEISLAVKDPDPPSESWLRINDGRDRGVVVYLARAVEVDAEDTITNPPEETPNG